jgi:hypothetical protein
MLRNGNNMSINVADGAAAFRQRLTEQTAAYSRVIRANNLRVE